MHQIVVATGNKGKLAEIKEILNDLPYDLIAMADLWTPVPHIPETGETFLENAKLKADWVFESSGLWALADDSGLEVDALRGRPGVLSARYAGEMADCGANNRKLLSELITIPMSMRTARFRCTIVLKISSQSYITADGVCEGRIGLKPYGNEGFGYDPLFIPDGYDKTFAQLSSSDKHRLSHRGKALASLREKLNGLSA